MVNLAFSALLFIKFKSQSLTFLSLSYLSYPLLSQFPFSLELFDFVSFKFKK